jgi:hypothetical protein
VLGFTMVKIINRLASCEGKDFSLDEKRKRLFVAVAVILSVISNSAYAIFDLVNGRFLKSGIGLFLILFLVSMVLFMRNRIRGLTVYRSILVVVSFILFDSFLFGIAKPSEILWFFVFPLGTFYLLGRKEGILYMAGVLIFSIILLWFPSILNSPTYLIDFKFRFIASLLFFTLFAFGMESLRIFYLRTTSAQDLKLETALINIKTLRGLLPICSSCKKIRGDDGYWSKLEDYVSKHTYAEFTHGICDNCLKKQYPDIYKTMKKEGFLENSSKKILSNQQTGPILIENSDNSIFNGEKRKRSFVYLGMIPVAIGTIILSIIEWIGGARGEAEFIAVIGLLIAAGVLYMKFSKDTKRPLRILATLVLARLIVPFFFASCNQFEILWFYSLPLGIFYIFGRKEGLFWVAPVVIFNIILMAMPSLFNRIPYSIDFIIGFSASSTVVIFLSYYNESLRDRFEKEMINKSLEVRSALDSVKTLTGLIPICATCKKIKDDKGYWSNVEEYIETHTEAESDHALCDKCATKSQAVSSVSNELIRETE